MLCISYRTTRSVIEGMALEENGNHTTMKELTINISKEFSRIIGGRERRISDHSGEEFRENFLEKNLDLYDRIIIELDGVLGYPVDFLDETFGRMARNLGKKAFREKFVLVSGHTYVTDKIDFLVDHCGKD